MRLTMKALAKLRHINAPPDVMDEIRTVVEQAETDFTDLVSLIAASAASAVSSTQLSTVYIYYPAISAAGHYDDNTDAWWRF